MRVLSVRGVLVGLLSTAALASTVAVGGCGRATFVVQQYAGPQRPSDTIAVLRQNGSDEVRVVELDDRDVSAPLERDTRLHIELLPARHTLAVAAATDERTVARRSARVAFRAEAGKVYRAALPPGAPVDGDAHVYEVDRNSDEVVRDVTEQPAPEPPPRVAAPPAPPEPSPAPEPDAGTPPPAPTETRP